MTTLLITLVFAWLLVKLQIFRPPRGQLNCGIFGFSGARPVDVTKLKWLAAENQSRGTDSTGVYGNHIFKEMGPAKSVITMPGFNAAIKGAYVVQGHARAASAGYSISKDNAHPFHYGFKDDSNNTEWAAEVVGAHNGFVIPEMVKHHQEVFGFKKEFSVDSQIIFAALAKTGDIKSISQIEGGMAISFQILSDNPNKLYLYRRQETRPLHIGEASDGLYYSSLEDPLNYIGCRSVWECLPNMLYTLENGEVVDIYRMPDPLLKSLAVNVSRGTWRQGLPHVELDALPKSATSRAMLPAYSGGTHQTNKFQRDFGFGNSRGFTQNKQNVTDRVATEYKNKTSLDTKFNMLVNNLSEEISKYCPVVLEPSTTTSFEHDHLSSCALVVHLVNQVNNKGLPAWLVLADGDTELAGITSGNGTTLIKVPVGKCSQDIRFLAYAPVEEYGPFEFTFRPEATRVVEVTLSIPFLKKGRKKEEITNTIIEHDNSENGDGTGQSSCSLPISFPEPSGLHVNREGDDRRLLPGCSTQISGGHSGQQTIGVLAKSDPYGTAIPETDTIIGFGPMLNERIKNTLPRLNERERQTLVGISLATDDYSCYKHYKDMPMSIVKWAQELPERGQWLSYYERNHIAVLKVSELIMDATRLMQRDRFIQQTWFPFWVYVELLLRDFFHDYVRNSFPYASVSVMNRVMFYPSAAIKSGSVTAEVKKKTEENNLSLESKTGAVLPYLIYTAFLNWLNDVNKISDMTDDKIKKIERHNQNLSDHIVNLTALLSEEEENSNLTLYQREVIMGARNLLKIEREDLQDYMEACRSIYKT